MNQAATITADTLHRATMALQHGAEALRGGGTESAEAMSHGAAVLHSGGAGVSHVGASGVASGADTLSYGGDSLANAVDSLSTVVTAPADFTALNSYADADSVFGVGSSLVPVWSVEGGTGTSLVAEPTFQLFVLLLAAIYILFIRANVGNISMLLSKTARDVTSRHKIFSDQGIGYSHFLNQALIVGVLFIGVLAVKFCDLWTPPSILSMLSPGAVMAMPVIMISLFCIFVIYEITLLWVVGGVTLSQPFIEELVYLKRVYLTLTVVAISPTILLFALSARNEGVGLLYFIAVEAVVVLVMFLKETLALFIHKKISILNWFLYLCAVEIFPVSLLWLMLIRS